MGERADAEAGINAGVASASRQEAVVLIFSAAAVAVPASQPGVETAGSSGRPVPEAASQSSTTSERSQMSRGAPSSNGPGILHNGRVPDFKAALR